MAKEDNQSQSQEQPPGRRFSQEQYDMLMRCSQKRDITEWNKWREENPDEEILLSGADLEGAYLKNVKLQRAHLENANFSDACLESAWLLEVHLENAELYGSHLEKAEFGYAHLKNAKLQNAHLEEAKLWKAHLEEVWLDRAHLENADLRGANLENAKLEEVRLENACLRGAHLENAYLYGAHLENANLGYAYLKNASFEGTYLRGVDFSNVFFQGANCHKAIVDGQTLIWDCKVDRKTNFEGVGLDSARVQPQIKQLLEYNIRRMNWEDWYRGKSKKKWVVKLHQLLTSPVRLFWSMSDYGLRTWRIILWFSGLALVFANIYYYWGRLAKPGIVENLFIDQKGIDVQEWLVPFRALYFSVVTQTTLGFGDMYAKAQSFWGHIFLSFQVILGYVLLGALVTRFAVLFTSGGPAGKFTKSRG